MCGTRDDLCLQEIRDGEWKATISTPPPWNRLSKELRCGPGEGNYCVDGESKLQEPQLLMTSCE